MTVIFSKKCELALQAVLYLTIKSKDDFHNAGDISKELQLPKEFVSKVLQKLTETGIVGSKKGKTGGFFLAKDPSEIRLIQIVEAIDGLEVFEKCVLGFPGCSPNNPCPLHNKWGYLRDEAFKMLTEYTLAELRDSAEKKIGNLKFNIV
jgi:Rrf2 family iron-sulfur cluster assembly transcriptional regulator